MALIKTSLTVSWAILIVAFFSFVNAANGAIISTELNDVGSKMLTPEKVCITQQCFKSASMIWKNMDITVEPCENFYRFACGKFLKESVIPKHESSVSLFSRTDKILMKQLRTSLERKMKKNAPRTFKVLQSFYKTCLDIDEINETSTNEVLDILKKLGDWPVLVGDSWNASNFDWRQLIYQMRKMGYIEAMNGLIQFRIEIDQRDNSRYVITLDQASTGLIKQYLSKGFKDKIVQAYYKYMINLATSLGAEKKRSKKELRDSLNFEIELAKISLPMEERKNMSLLYNPMTLDELQLEYPDISWSEYLNRILLPQTKLYKSSFPIIVKVPNFLKALLKLINSTPKRVLANYAIWRVVQESDSFMNEHVKRIKADFMASIIGTNVQVPRWIQCLDYVSQKLYLAVGALYVREHFDKKSKVIAEELVDRLRRSFAGLLEKIHWMDEKTKNTAKKKLRSVKDSIAYPDEFLEDEKIDAYFQNLEVNSESFLKKHLNLNLFKFKKVLEKLIKPVDENDWTTTGYSAIVEAFYYPPMNRIIIPAGILQGQFFTSGRPHYMNYAAIGWVIGHELTHGFDNEGRQFDENGDLVNWWDPETLQEYLNRTECIIQQYSNYTVNGFKLNGVNTQGENIADNGGIKEAYLAYEEYERTHGQEFGLPGLPYTPRQLFWISAANVWCSKSRHEMLEHSINTGVHSPHEFRVIGSFSNIPEFSRDFNCPVGSPMNPTKKCAIW
ncbi:neprilysin-2-like [Phymastichus coffea]|uniref:neprilysin-2-like n=1 Tax=Phymastichus coffea TaxID=108790 RepID=UPI00273BD0FC|nr:neprilysin-2-like [Phymastichus coffea]